MGPHWPGPKELPMVNSDIIVSVGDSLFLNGTKLSLVCPHMSLHTCTHRYTSTEPAQRLMEMVW